MFNKLHKLPFERRFVNKALFGLVLVLYAIIVGVSLQQISPDVVAGSQCNWCGGNTQGWCDEHAYDTGGNKCQTCDTGLIKCPTTGSCLPESQCPGDQGGNNQCHTCQGSCGTGGCNLSCDGANWRECGFHIASQYCRGQKMSGCHSGIGGYLGEGNARGKFIVSRTVDRPNTDATLDSYCSTVQADVIDSDGTDAKVAWIDADGVKCVEGTGCDPSTMNWNCDNTPPPPQSCGITAGFTCEANGSKTRVNWNATSTGFDIAPGKGSVVVRISDPRDGWVGPLDTWWWTQAQGFIDSGQDPSNGSWLFDIEPNIDYTLRVAVNPTSETYKVEGLCSTANMPMQCDSELPPRPSVIAGHKYNDISGDGDQQSSEPNLEGWGITLYNENFSSIYGTDTTNSQGRYSFSNMSPGQYHVCETMQSNWNQTEPSIGIVRNNTYCHTVTISAGQSKTDLDFGNREQLVASNGSISGYKYYDEDKDGHKGSNESFLDGWVINLYKDSVANSVLATKSTGISGDYKFEGLEPGTYFVCEEMKTPWRQTEPDTGVQKVGTYCHQVNLTAGESYIGAVFGNTLDTALVSSIHGYKYDDTNKNGAKDSSEGTIENWNISL